MMKSEKAHGAGRGFLILGIVFAVLTLIVAGIHCMKYSWMPFELIFQLPFEILPEHVMIGAGVTVIFLAIAWICFGVASRRAKQEAAVLQNADDSVFEERGAEVVVCRGAREQHKTDRDTKATIGKIAVPAVVIGVCSLALVFAGKKMKKAKHRRDFYRWLG